MNKKNSKLHASQEKVSFFKFDIFEQKRSNLVIWAKLFGLMLIVFIASYFVEHWWTIGGDTNIYFSYAQRVFSGDIPYKDFLIEYPPGVLPFILLAWPLGSFGANYDAGYVVLTFTAVLIFLRILYSLGGTRIALLFCGLIILMGLYFFYLLDIFAALALVGTVLSLVHKKYILSAILLAGAVLIKFYPLVCLPIILVYLPRTMIKKYLVVFSGIIFLGVLPFLIVAPRGFWHSIEYHLNRPLQIESGPAAIGYLLKPLGVHLLSFVSHKSFALGYSGANTVAVASTVLMIVCLIIIYLRFYILRQKSFNNLILGCLASLLTYVIFFKVGSPQYLIPVFLLSFLIMPTLKSTEQRQLITRLYLIGLLVYITLGTYYDLKGLNGWAEILVIMRYVLLINLLIWVLRKCNLINLAEREGFEPSRRLSPP